VRLVRPYRAERTFFVKREEAGLPLAQVLAERFPFRSTDVWQQRIAAGSIHTDGNHVCISEGNRVVHITAETVEPSVPDLLACLKDEGNWSVWFKPAPLPMHAGGRYHRNTFETMVREKLERPVFLVHRLDSVTSGLVLVAHDAETARILTNAFEDKRAEKIYAAVVSGTPEPVLWQCKLPVRRKSGYVFETHPDGSTAETLFERVETDGQVSLVLCRPLTGRTHQLRLHLRATGFPIVDDPVYGAQVENPTDSILQNAAISLVHIALRIPGLDIPELLC
jgi:RluA family pseudouridine synthase